MQRTTNGLRTLAALIASILLGGLAFAQEGSRIDSASDDIQNKLEQSLAELSGLRQEILDEKLPLAEELADLEQQLSAAREELSDVNRDLAQQGVNLANLTREIESRRNQATFLTGILSEYVRKFESRLRIAERQRYAGAIEAAHLALENTALPAAEVFRAHTDLLDAAIGRLEEQVGGTIFDGTAVTPAGTVKDGSFLMFGPVTLFRSADGSEAGGIESRINSLEPTIVPFEDPLLAEAAASAISSRAGDAPIDLTLGSASELEATRDGFIGTVKKGGLVMIPIFAMAGAAFLVALFKWIGLSFVRTPRKKRVAALLDAVSKADVPEAVSRAREIRGPAGRMLVAGAEHLGEPRELIEEVMYEHMLTARMKTQRFLPFVAICAASAPLLGLLGTVTGIINTFKQITVFGSGDVKMLSGGISEALITTQFGLIVAIPSLLLHAFLSRKARGVTGNMEKNAIAFINEVARSPLDQPKTVPSAAAGGAVGVVADPELVRRQVNEILGELLGSTDSAVVDAR